MLKGCPIREGFEQWCEPCLRRIHVAPNKYMDNNNPKPDIEKLKRDVLENLRELAHTPSAHIRTETPDGHAKRHTNCLPAPWYLQQMMHAVLEEAGTPSGQLVRRGLLCCCAFCRLVLPSQCEAVQLVAL